MVYLVDDDADDLEMLREALFENSYKGPVMTHGNGQVLMDSLQRENGKPDVIVLDLNMPLKDGFETLREIKQTPRLSEIPVIVLTASTRKEDETKCFALGCNFFMNKPYEMSGYTGLARIVKKFIVRSS